MVKKTLKLGLISGLIGGFLFISSCSDRNPHKLDLAGHEVEVSIERLEADIFQVASTEDYVQLNTVDSVFMAAFKRGIMGPETLDGRIPAAESAKGLMEFTAHPDMQHLYNIVDSVYADISDIETELSQALSYYKYHFPKKQVPQVYTLVTPFRAQNVITENGLGICLDMYLGADFDPYQTPALQFPQFLIRKFRRDYITRNAIKGWLESEYAPPAKDIRLLSEMIFQGKILYALDALLVDTPDSIKIGYKAGSIEWCHQNEVQIWSHLINEELLYSTELRKYMGVITDGPFSKGTNVPQDAPPQIAAWTGWQIVRQFMEKQSDVSLAQLMEMDDADYILKASGYKP